MKVGILYFPENRSGLLLEYAKAVAAGLESQNKSADIINAYTDTVRGTMYSYLCIITEATGGLFSRKSPIKFSQTLEQCSSINGKRVCLFFIKKPLFTEKYAQSLMQTLESQGLFLRNSCIAKTTEAFKAFAQSLNVDLLPRA